MATPFTGVKVIKISSTEINKLFKDKALDLLPTIEYPNSFIVLKGEEQQSALTRVSKDGKSVSLISEKLSASGIKARNKEQLMALDILLDPEIEIVALTGIAGSGKSLITVAAAMELFDKSKYSRIILTRPMDAMGGMKDLGAMPGSIDEKFSVYLHNFVDNINVTIKNKTRRSSSFAMDLARQYNMEFIPMQVMRGASFNDALIIADEIQTLSHKQMLGLGSRVGENSKLILLGDLDQIDTNIKKHDTGLFKFMNDELVKSSSFTASLQLIKSERSRASALFVELFSEK